MVRDVIGDLVGDMIGDVVGDVVGDVGDVVRWRLDQKEDAAILNTSGGRDTNT